MCHRVGFYTPSKVICFIHMITLTHGRYSKIRIFFSFVLVKEVKANSDLMFYPMGPIKRIKYGSTYKIIVSTCVTVILIIMKNVPLSSMLYSLRYSINTCKYSRCDIPDTSNILLRNNVIDSFSDGDKWQFPSNDEKWIN